MDDMTMFELIEYVGALGQVVKLFETLYDCQHAAHTLNYYGDGLALYVCEVEV